jgi:hypothetical protein
LVMENVGSAAMTEPMFIAPKINSPANINSWRNLGGQLVRKGGMLKLHLAIFRCFVGWQK